MKFAAIIVAAGSSRRMGFDKLLASLRGKPVLQHSIETFLDCPSITNIIVVCPADRFDSLDLEFSNKVIQRVDGGVDRHDSVAAGLAVLPSDIDYISVHDGARPLITEKQIAKVLQAAVDHGAAASARPVTETVKRANGDCIVTESVSRDNLWLMETPQIFKASLLVNAYQQVQQSGARVTDEVSAMELIGQAVQLVSNDSANPKITYPADIDQAEKLLG
ncbi:2-C-methyl-D-erythritol 4-phosphate cytidylyltransferase [Oceaniferula spumae]|uniref:2-C-methyl-D-erythritol 4-phosphate cytidylyltransferase n=1 Tax=Oceaniferula spumae TaxID=2979115 RepID=A0AAT9FH93_9BACT